MQRGRALKRGRWLSLFAAGIVGYLLGDWHAAALRTADLSASQSIALRFPEMKADSAVVDAAAEMPAVATNAIMLADASTALLSPAPMVSSPLQQASAQVPVRVAMAEDAVPSSAPVTATARQGVPAVPPVQADAKPTAAAPTKAESKSSATMDAVRRANRPGFVLNDAQIASIKKRLHLSPDQEQMWPAVEAALRNIAYAKAHDGRRHGGAESADVASLDPYGPEVQGLKSAAFPLIMSFSDEQRSEVRTLAHVMGLDQLASQL